MTNDHNHHDKESKQTILSDIETYGCHLALLEPDNYLPGFAYTIGLFKKFEHPEIICFGLQTNVMASILNYACDLIKQGQNLVSGKSYSGFLQGYDIQFIQVDKEYYANYLGYGGWFYDNTFDFPVLQLVWPDKQNHFPWDEGFNSDWKFKQPLLDRNVDFKFYEERNLGVYTSKQALAGHPILFVYHNDDGDWQFHTSEEPELIDAKLVCLEDMTKLDPTLNEIYYLQFGWHAWRNSPTDDWEYAEDKLEN